MILPQDFFFFTITCYWFCLYKGTNTGQTQKHRKQKKEPANHRIRNKKQVREKRTKNTKQHKQASQITPSKEGASCGRRWNQADAFPLQRDDESIQPERSLLLGQHPIILPDNTLYVVVDVTTHTVTRSNAATVMTPYTNMFCREHPVPYSGWTLLSGTPSLSF